MYFSECRYSLTILILEACWLCLPLQMMQLKAAAQSSSGPFPGDFLKMFDWLVDAQLSRATQSATLKKDPFLGY
jgi:hypothetical protein